MLAPAYNYQKSLKYTYIHIFIQYCVIEFRSCFHLDRFEFVLEVLEDAVNDAPRAAEFLGRMFAKIILENVISLSDIGKLIREGGEEKGRLVEVGIAADVLGSIFNIIESEEDKSVLNELRSSSNLRVEDFRPAGSNKKSRIDKYITT